MKKCLKCKQWLSLDNFHRYNRKSKYTGKFATYYTSYCKECNKLRCLERRHSEEGMLTDIYNGQICSSKKRKHPLPNYTFDALKDWITSQSNYRALLQGWVESEYDSNLKPSCDRKDDALPYTIENLSLMTWEENARKYKEGKQATGGGDCKAVSQFKDGVLVATYHSIAEASRQSGAAKGNIQRCCSGQYKTSKGFVWRYANAE